MIITKSKWGFIIVKEREDFYSAFTWRERFNMWFPDRVSIQFREDFEPYLKYWWLLREEYDTATLHSWRSSWWWRRLLWDFLRPMFKFAIKQGWWHIPEGGYYWKDGIEHTEWARSFRDNVCKPYLND